MVYQNRFHRVLERVDEKAVQVLQLAHRIGGLSLDDLVDGESYLGELAALTLVAQLNGIWRTTWAGAGVANWRAQLALGWQERVCEPGSGENGKALGPPSLLYRAALFAPGYCWCCRKREEHCSEILKAAQDLLRFGSKA